jgi:translation initiation factor 2B subunit (eIF-2B alpha/beta/delta family)
MRTPDPHEDRYRWEQMRELKEDVQSLQQQLHKTQGEMITLQRIILGAIVALFGVSNPVTQKFLEPTTAIISPATPDKLAP